MVIQSILQKLIAEYTPEKVILFGSHAYGAPGPDSDIDLLIIKETSERFIDRWVTVQRILTGTHRSLPVETLVLTPQEIENRLAIGDQFIVEILEKGKVLFYGAVSLCYRSWHNGGGCLQLSGTGQGAYRRASSEGHWRMTERPPPRLIGGLRFGL